MRMLLSAAGRARNGVSDETELTWVDLPGGGTALRHVPPDLVRRRDAKTDTQISSSSRDVLSPLLRPETAFASGTPSRSRSRSGSVTASTLSSARTRTRTSANVLRKREVARAHKLEPRHLEDDISGQRKGTKELNKERLLFWFVLEKEKNGAPFGGWGHRSGE